MLQWPELHSISIYLSSSFLTSLLEDKWQAHERDKLQDVVRERVVEDRVVEDRVVEDLDAEDPAEDSQYNLPQMKSSNLLRWMIKIFLFIPWVRYTGGKGSGDRKWPLDSDKLP